MPIVGNRFIDTFIVDVAASAGLSPYECAYGIKLLLPELSKLRPSASIWVRVDSPGFWYPIELQKTLSRTRAPVAVTRTTAKTIGLADFCCMPQILKTAPLPPPIQQDSLFDMDENLLRCLRVMARITVAFTAEISSLAGLSEGTTRACLKQLAQGDYLTWIDPLQQSADQRSAGFSRHYPYWQITRRGTSVALRSWGIPLGFCFAARREVRWNVSFRHRRVSRLWLAWLRRAVFYGKIWAGWSEVRMPGLRICPDALAWGKFDSKEILFWLEVDSGHKSAMQTRKRMRKKFFVASRYAEASQMNLVFAILARPWVIKVAQTAFSGLADHTAVILADWRSFGTLPNIQWGRVRLVVDGERSK